MASNTSETSARSYAVSDVKADDGRPPSVLRPWYSRRGVTCASPWAVARREIPAGHTGLTVEDASVSRGQKRSSLSRDPAPHSSARIWPSYGAGRTFVKPWSTTLGRIDPRY